MLPIYLEQQESLESISLILFKDFMCSNTWVYIQGTLVMSPSSGFACMNRISLY